MQGKASPGDTIVYGDFGLQALEPGWIKARQIESGRRVLTRYVWRKAKLWVCIFLGKPVTMRAAKCHMGSGKGLPEYWVAVLKPGKIIYELTGLNELVPRKALRITGHKMPIRIQIVINLNN